MGKTTKIKRGNQDCLLNSDCVLTTTGHYLRNKISPQTDI